MFMCTFIVQLNCYALKEYRNKQCKEMQLFLHNRHTCIIYICIHSLHALIHMYIQWNTIGTNKVLFEYTNVAFETCLIEVSSIQGCPYMK